MEIFGAGEMLSKVSRIMTHFVVTLDAFFKPFKKSIAKQINLNT